MASGHPIKSFLFSDAPSNDRFLGANCHRSQSWCASVTSTDASKRHRRGDSQKSFPCWHPGLNHAPRNLPVGGRRDCHVRIQGIERSPKTRFSTCHRPLAFFVVHRPFSARCRLSQGQSVLSQWTCRGDFSRPFCGYFRAIGDRSRLLSLKRSRRSRGGFLRILGCYDDIVSGGG